MNTKHWRDELEQAMAHRLSIGMNFQVLKAAMATVAKALRKVDAQRYEPLIATMSAAIEEYGHEKEAMFDVQYNLWREMKAADCADLGDSGPLAEFAARTAAERRP